MRVRIPKLHWIFVQDRFFRAGIVPDSAVVVQQDLVHFHWQMDIGRVDEDGQLTLIAGFFGALEPDR